MKVIAYINAKGVLCICRPVQNMFDPQSLTRAALRNRGVDFANEEEVFAWIMGRDIPASATQVTVLDEAEIPARLKRLAASTPEEMKAVIPDALK